MAVGWARSQSVAPRAPRKGALHPFDIWRGRKRTEGYAGGSPQGPADPALSPRSYGVHLPLDKTL
eukprot:8819193-Pyramimonas_sp.AAC.1